MMNNFREDEIKTGAGPSTGESDGSSCSKSWPSTLWITDLKMEPNTEAIYSLYDVCCRCLPMNLIKEDLLGIHKDRMKIGASLADVDPMHIDRTVSCQS